MTCNPLLPKPDVNTYIDHHYALATVLYVQVKNIYLLTLKSFFPLIPSHTVKTTPTGIYKSKQREEDGRDGGGVQRLKSRERKTVKTAGEQ